MIKANLHTHSLYCDGKNSIEEMIASAINKNFDVLGFSSHAPVPFENKFAIKNAEELSHYAQEVTKCKEKYKDKIDIYLSLEIDYIPQITTSFEEFRMMTNLDYTIGGIHLVKNPYGHLWFIDGGKYEVYDEGLQTLFNNDIKQAVKAYFYQVNEMIEKEQPDIIAHFDKIKMHNRNRFFLETDKWYSNLIDESLHLMKEYNTILEINTRGVYKGRSKDLFPDIPVLKKAVDLNIPICINSDAHHVDELDMEIDLAKEKAIASGYKEFFYFKKNNWVVQSLI